MDRYCGPCRNRAWCPTHPHALDDRREDRGRERVVALVFLLLLAVAGWLVWEYVAWAVSS